MSSVSKKQKKIMAIADANPEFAKEVGIPHAVAHEFHEADKKKDAEEHAKHDDKKD